MTNSTILTKILNIFSKSKINKNQNNNDFILNFCKTLTIPQKILIIEKFSQPFFDFERNEKQYLNHEFSNILNQFFSRYKKISYESAMFSIQEIESVPFHDEWIIIGHTVEQDGAKILTKKYTNLIDYDDSFFIESKKPEPEINIFDFVVKDYLFSKYGNLPIVEAENNLKQVLLTLSSS